MIPMCLDQPTRECIHSLPIMLSIADLATRASRFRVLYERGRCLEYLKAIWTSGVSTGVRRGKEMSFEGEYVGESLPVGVLSVFEIS